MIALSIANLLACVFTIDITERPHCSEFLRIVSALIKSRSIHSYLDGVSLPVQPHRLRSYELEFAV